MRLDFSADLPGHRNFFFFEKKYGSHLGQLSFWDIIRKIFDTHFQILNLEEVSSAYN